MNRLVSAGIGALLSLALAASASAAQLAPVNPADPNFTLQGPVTFLIGFQSFPCKLTITGVVNASGTATINTATLGGDRIGICPFFQTRGLPWTLSASSLTSLQISGVQVQFPFTGAKTCGPTTINMSWTTTAATFTSVSMTGTPPPDCVFTGYLPATNLTVVP